VLQFLVTANIVPGSVILFALVMEAIDSSEKLVLTRATRRYITKGGILLAHRSEKIKSYIALCKI
jgi:hypothetical protein